MSKNVVFIDGTLSHAHFDAWRRSFKLRLDAQHGLKVYFTPLGAKKQSQCGKLNLAVERGVMISPRQIRAARALLGWSQQDLADRAIVSMNSVARIERGQVDARVSTIVAIERTLTKAGVEFLSAGDRGEGVRMKSPKL
jgi:DNA-binding XRE family transcriptional regulator